MAMMCALLLCSVYGQFAIFIFAAWAGVGNGGVIAGLAICGVVVAAVSQAAVLMQVSCATPCCDRPAVCCWLPAEGTDTFDLHYTSMLSGAGLSCINLTPK